MSDAVEIRDLAKSYPDFAMENVNLVLPAGYVMGLVGPNGAGKTTMLKMILGLVRKDSGVLRVLGLDPEKHEIEIKSKIGYVHDEPCYYPNLTLNANARLIAPLYPTWEWNSFDRLCERFQLPTNKRFGELSRGTKTRFALTVALAHHAELLVMDEPTTGLDPVARRELLDTLLETLQDEKVSVIFSTHITSDIERIADYITLLQDGGVVLSASKDEILETWALVKGGLDLLDVSAAFLLKGIHRSPYGFVALTDQIDEVRKQFGNVVQVERASLEDLVYYTRKESSHA